MIFVKDGEATVIWDHDDRRLPSAVKNPPTSAGHMALIPELGRSPGKGKCNLLKYSCLGNPMDREVQWAAVHGAAKSWT